VSTADILAEIERLYYATTPQTIQQDFARAIDLLKQLPDEDTRSKAAVYMEGLADMRGEWGGRPRPGGARTKPPRA
jgi:hypothetical protein